MREKTPHVDSWHAAERAAKAAEQRLFDAIVEQETDPDSALLRAVREARSLRAQADLLRLEASTELRLLAKSLPHPDRQARADSPRGAAPPPIATRQTGGTIRHLPAHAVLHPEVENAKRHLAQAQDMLRRIDRLLEEHPLVGRSQCQRPAANEPTAAAPPS